MGGYEHAYEARTGRLGTGYAVEEYKRDFESYAGNITFAYANVIRCRGQRGTKLPTGTRLNNGAVVCRQYDQIPPGTRLVVFQGVDVARHLQPDLKGPLKWRGFIINSEEKSDNTEHSV